MLWYTIVSYDILYYSIPYYSTISYTRSPLEDFRLFGPSPWKILAATYEKDTSEQPSPWRKSSKRESCYGDRVYGVRGVAPYYSILLHTTPYYYSTLLFYAMF